MINYFINFVQKNLIVILVVMTLIALLSFSFKKFRRLIYGGLTLGTASLGFVVMHRAGLGFNQFYEFVQKAMYSSTKILEEIQQCLIENKIILSEIVSLGSGFMFDPLYVCDTFYAYNIQYAIYELASLIAEIKIEIKTRLTTMKEEFVRKINLSKFTYAYRL